MARDPGYMTEPLFVTEIAVSSFLVHRDIDLPQFTGGVRTHVDETNGERWIVIRFEMGSAQARALRAQLNALQRDEH
jgi:hypothetical protein